MIETVLRYIGLGGVTCVQIRMTLQYPSPSLHLPHPRRQAAAASILFLSSNPQAIPPSPRPPSSIRPNVVHGCTRHRYRPPKDLLSAAPWPGAARARQSLNHRATSRQPWPFSRCPTSLRCFQPKGSISSWQERSATGARAKGGLALQLLWYGYQTSLF